MTVDSSGKWALGAGVAVFAATTVVAQLPTARLDGVFPRGVQAGAQAEIVLQGADLDDVRALIFSHPGLTATHVEAAKFRVTAAADVPPGAHEVRAAGRYGISTGALIAVGSVPEATEPADNHAPATAAKVPLPVALNGTADPDNSDYFRFTAAKGRPVHLDCAAQRLDSPLNAVISVRDPSGLEIMRARRTLDRDPVARFVPEVDGDYTLEVHDATWRGGSSFVYRLTATPDEPPPSLPSSVPLAGALLPSPAESPVAEVEPNDTATASQRIDFPCEVNGTLDRDWFEITVAEARPVIIEVASHRMGIPSDPIVVVHKVTKDPSAAEQLSQVAEFDDTPGPPGAERFRLGSRDPAGRLNAEAKAVYRLFVTDRFQTGGRYRLLIREPRPDFQVLVLPESPAGDGKSLVRWTPFLRRQGTSALAVAVVRQDGFDDPVIVKADSLPAGVSLAECLVPAGLSSGLAVFRASADAPAWSGPIAISGHAGERVRPAREATPRWSVGDAGAERVDLRLAVNGPMLAVSEEGGVPLVVDAAAVETFETSLGATLEVPVKFVRAPSHKGFKGEWEAALFGLPGQRAWQPAKPAGDAGEAKLTLALTRKDGNQFVAGTWTMYAATRATVQWQPDEKIPVREVRDATFSAPIQVRIASSPASLSAPEAVTVARGGQVALGVTLERRFGFAEVVQLSLRLPDGLTGVAAAALTVPKESSEGKLTVEAKAEAPPGRHAAVLEAKCQWNGEELVSRRDVVIEITP